MKRLPRKARLALALAAPVAVLSALATNAFVAEAAPHGGVTATCVENIPSGATRPEMTETFPDDAIAGYTANLELIIKHGKGETVFPNGFRVQPGSEASRALERAGFAIPEVDGGSGPKLETKVDKDSAITKVTLPIVVLPRQAGRVSMSLPSLPITLARADNELMTICTGPHDIVVEDPVAAETDPQVKPNPPGRHQREPWPFLVHLLEAVLLGLLIGAIAGYFIVKQLKRPKPVKPVPKRVPWVVALEELDQLKQSTLLKEGKKAEYFDAVSDCIRKYLGMRYGFEALGFDGIDTTSDEMRALLKRVKPGIKNLDDIGLFLSDCDLVKFARLVPTEAECTDTLEKGTAIVKETMPATPTAATATVGPTPPPEAPPPPPAPPPLAPPPAEAQP